MHPEWIDLNLEYTSSPDPESPHIACLALPRPGDIIITESGKRYRVIQLQFDAQRPAAASPANITALVEPAHGK